MGIQGVHHLVLRVEDVPEGEAYYRELFGMTVLFREGGLDGTPGTVPEDVTWDDARSKGVTPYMSFLGRDGFCLAVGAAGDVPAEGRVDHVALEVDEGTFEGVTRRGAELECEVERNASHHRVLADRFGVEWELNAKPRPPSPAFETLDL